MKLRVGHTVASTVDATKLIVVRAPDEDVSITCGGVPMVDAADGAPAAGGTPDPAQQDGTQLGKRYTNDELGIELLCTKPGQGTVAVNGVALVLRSAKPLPASD